MTILSVDEYDLIAFFGSTHVSREYGTEWWDSDSVYKFQQADGVTVTCAVHPIHKDARITLSWHSRTYYDWQATALADIGYERSENFLRFSTQSGDVLTLRITPHIAVSHQCLFRREEI